MEQFSVEVLNIIRTRMKEFDNVPAESFTPYIILAFSIVASDSESGAYLTAFFYQQLDTEDGSGPIGGKGVTGSAAVKSEKYSSVTINYETQSIEAFKTDGDVSRHALSSSAYGRIYLMLREVADSVGVFVV